jgi:DNA-binding SARP family transcriptional activator
VTERAHVDIRLLGPIAAFRDGEPAALGGPRQRAVLARLALVVGQVVTVDRLIEDVWAGDPPPTATNTVQSYVSLLRRAMGSADAIRRDGPGYVLTVPRTALDAQRFEDGVAGATPLVTSDPAAALEALDLALGEWRGPCLADVADEEWARAAIVRWDELRLAATELRYDALLSLGRAAEAASGLERLTDEHPLREGFVRRLMLALYRSGRQADALRAFSRTRTVLAEELGLDPTPELQALQLAILDHDPSLAGPTNIAPTPTPTPRPTPAVVPSQPAAPEPAPSASPAADARRGPGLPLPGAAARAAAPELVGRDRHLAALDEVWRSALGGRPRLAVLVGEAGAGKTTIAGHFATRLQAQQASVLWGRAAQDAIVPFEPLVQALRTALNALSPRARERVISDRAAMTVLLPELPQLVPGMRAERPPAEVERHLLLETVTDLLAAESAIAPILLVVEDVQWADAATIKLLEHVVRDERTSRVMLLLTQRVPSERTHPDLDRLLMSLAREGELTRIQVEALDDEAVGELLHRAGRPRTGAGPLRAITGGNAFFVTEVIASGMGRDGSGTEVPESIRAMLNTRLDRLPAPSAHIVAVAAVAGAASTLPVIVAATERAADDVLDAADVAIAAGLLREDGAGRLVTPHALVRQAVLERLTGPRRQDHHRRLFAALRQAAGSEVAAAELAHHALAAGNLVPPAERVAAALAAAEEALALVAYEEAVEWVERARQLVEPDQPADAAALEIADSAARRTLGDREGAEGAAQRAWELAVATGDPILQARAAESWVLSISGVGFDFAQATVPALSDVLDAAIEALPEDAVDHQVWLRSMLVSALVDTGQFARQEALSDAALTIARRTNDPGLLASALYARRLALWQRDRLDERLPLAFEAIAHARRAGDLHLELTAMLVTMIDLLESGRIDEQLAMLDEFEQRSSRLRSPLYDVYAKFLRSCRLVVTGEYEEAERIANEALAAGLASHGPNTETAHAGQMFCMAWDRGQLGDLVELVELMVGTYDAMPIWRVALAGALAAAGRDDEARDVFHALVTDDGLALPDNSLFFTGACFLVEVARALDDRRGAAVLRRTLEPYAGRVAITGLGGVGIGPVRRYVGVAAHLVGDLDAAIEHLTLAAAESERHGSRPFTARAHHDLARALTDRDRPGDAEAAAAHAATAAAIASEVGLVLGRI